MSKILHAYIYTIYSSTFSDDSVSDAVEAHSCVDADSEMSLDEQCTAAIIFNGRTFRPKGLCHLCHFLRS